MIELYKIITGKYDSNCDLQLYLHSESVHTSVTRGNNYKYWHLSIVDMTYENIISLIK